MTTVQNGSKVTFHYKGTLKDGSEFDSSYNREEPMTTVAGQGNLIAGFEDALSGMSVGESKTFTVEAAKAYGERDPDATTELEKTIFPDDFEFKYSSVADGYKQVGNAVPVQLGKILGESLMKHLK